MAKLHSGQWQELGRTRFNIIACLFYQVQQPWVEEENIACLANMQLMPHKSLRADLGDLYSIKKEKPLKAPPNDNMILDKKKHTTLV